MTGATAKGNRRGIGKTSTIYIAGSFVGKGARFLLIPIYVHQLNPLEVGMLVFLEAISVGLSRAFNVGFGHAVKRFYVDYPTEHEADNFVAALWWARFAFAAGVGGLLSAGILLYGNHLTQQVPAEFLALAVVSGTLRGNVTIGLERFIVRSEPYWHGLFNIGRFATTALFVIAAVVVLELGVRGALWADIAAFAVWNVVVAVVVSRRRWPTFHWPDLSAAIRYSLPAAPHSLSAWALTFADRIILERLVPLAQLGVYGIGYQFASVLPIFSLALVNAWIPRFYRKAGAEQGPAGYARVFTLQLAWVTAIALPLIAFAPELIGIVTTSEYSGAVPIMRVVLVALILQGAYQALTLPLFYQKRTALVSVVTGIALAINIGSNLVLIPRAGIMGAAIATLLAYGTASALALALVARTYPIPVDYGRVGTMAAAATAAVICAVSLAPSPSLLAISFKMGSLAIFYLPVAFLPGFVLRGEPPLVRRVLRSGRPAAIPRQHSTGPKA